MRRLAGRPARRRRCPTGCRGGWPGAASGGAHPASSAAEVRPRPAQRADVGAGPRRPAGAAAQAPTWLPAVAAGVALVLAGGWSAGRRSTGTRRAGRVHRHVGRRGRRRRRAGRRPRRDADGTSRRTTGRVAAPASSGTDYADEAQRAAALPRLLADAPTPTASGSASAAPEPAAPRGEPPPRRSSPAGRPPALDAAARPGGAGRVPGRPAEPATPTCLAVDYARVRRRPAARRRAARRAPAGRSRSSAAAAPRPTRLVLTVVGPGCSAAGRRTLVAPASPGR